MPMPMSVPVPATPGPGRAPRKPEPATPELILTDQAFERFRTFIHGIAGISLAPSKKSLVLNRLARRLRHHGLTCFDDYYRLLRGEREERQIAVDLLTTNETHFFREPRHFERLRDGLLSAHPRNRGFRVWSAACSSGEEVYTLAMLLADTLGDAPWEVLGSDISRRVLDQAESGLYPMERAKELAQEHLRRYCLKGVGGQTGSFLIDPRLRARVRFAQINLTTALPSTGTFDAIFLRNVMIYFQADTKRQVVEQLLGRLRPGGWFFVGHAESLHGVVDGLETVAPAVYRAL